MGTSTEGEVIPFKSAERVTGKYVVVQQNNGEDLQPLILAEVRVKIKPGTKLWGSTKALLDP